MPTASPSLPSSRAAAAYRPSRRTATAFVAATIATIAWGTFAFGAVYPWAYRPLAVACTAVGVFGLTIGRTGEALRRYRTLFIALQCVLAIGLLQLIPVPRGLLAAISPATDRFLAQYDLGYAFSGIGGDALLGARWHSLSIDPRATLRGLQLFVAFAIFLAGLLAALSRDVAVRLGRLLVVMGVVLALVGIGQYLLLGNHAWGGMKIYGFWKPRYLLTTPFGPYVNKNHFAGWMLMVMPIAIGRIGSALERLSRRGADLHARIVWLSTPEGGRFLLTLFGIALMGFAVLMTESRSGIGCIVLGAVLTAVLSRRSGSRASGLIAATALLAVFIAAAFWAGVDTSLRRFVTDPDAARLRLNIWHDAVAVVRDFPVFGTGLNTFGTATTVYQTTHQQDVHFQEAHNDLLQLVVEGGVVLGAAVLFTIGAFVAALVSRIRSEVDDPESHWLRVGATIGLLLIAAQSLVEFSLQMPGNAALFTLLLALALHRPRSKA